MIRQIQFIASFILLCILYSGCSDCDCVNAPTAKVADEQAVLTDVTAVITTSYDEVYNSSIELQVAISHFRDVKTSENLDIAREAWRVCRAKWMVTQAFLFGPVQSAQLTKTIDTWPISPTNLGGTLLTPDDIHFRDGAVKGFHTIEYLIFGDSSNKTVANFTEREFDYLSALMVEFTRQIEYLVALWANYAVNLEQAGTTESEFATTQDAFKLIAVNESFLLDAAADVTMLYQLYHPKPNSIESQYSRNTNHDFANIIQGIKNIYLGGYEAEGKGLSTLVVRSDKALDTRIRVELDAAMTALGDMTPWFGEALITNMTKVQSAKTSLATLQADLNLARAIITK